VKNVADLDLRFRMSSAGQTPTNFQDAITPTSYLTDSRKKCQLNFAEIAEKNAYICQNFALYPLIKRFFLIFVLYFLQNELIQFSVKSLH
jgi:hypothetical protein